MKLLASSTSALVFLSAISCLVGCTHQFTVVTYGGGGYEDAVSKNICKPFGQEHHLTVTLINWGAAYGQLQQMVASGNVQWDVVEVTAAQFERGKKDNLFEPINVSINTQDYLSGSLDPKGLANVYWSTVIAYPSREFKNNPPPSGWKDFWDTTKYPGKRALYDDPRGNVEFALLADGESKEHLYQNVDLDRAFRKLTSIKPYILKWWTDGTEPVQLLLTHQVVMTSAWNGRLYASLDARRSVGYSYTQAATDRTFWVIPRGARNKSIAQEFLSFASDAKRLSSLIESVGYGTANVGALRFISPPIQNLLPTTQQNLAAGFQISADWWAKHEEELNLRWLRWKSE